MNFTFPKIYGYKKSCLETPKFLKLHPSNTYRIWCAFLFCFDAFLILQFNNGIFSSINFPRRIEKAFLQFSLGRKLYTTHTHNELKQFLKEQVLKVSSLKYFAQNSRFFCSMNISYTLEHEYCIFIINSIVGDKFFEIFR